MLYPNTRYWCSLSVLACLLFADNAASYGGGPVPKNILAGEPSKVIIFPVTVIRGPLLKITTRISSGGAASGCGPQALCNITAGSLPRSITGTKARADSNTALGAVGLTQSTMLVAWNVSSDPRGDTGATSSLQLAVPSNIRIQLSTPFRSGSAGSVAKANRCPANRCRDGARLGIRARSGVLQDMLSE